MSILIRFVVGLVLLVAICIEWGWFWGVVLILMIFLLSFRTKRTFWGELDLSDWRNLMSAILGLVWYIAGCYAVYLIWGSVATGTIVVILVLTLLFRDR